MLTAMTPFSSRENIINRNFRFWPEGLSSPCNELLKEIFSINRDGRTIDLLVDSVWLNMLKRENEANYLTHVEESTVLEEMKELGISGINN